MDFNEDFKTNLKKDKKVYDVDHESLSQQDIEALMQKDLGEISSIFGVDVSTLQPIMRQLDPFQRHICVQFPPL